MRFTARTRKNFAIFSLVSILGLISYVNYSINQQALLETSSELEKYEISMMEENGALDDLLDETPVFSDEDGDKTDKTAKGDTAQGDIKDNDEEKKLDNATIVDSRGNNDVTDLVEASNTEIAKTVTSKKLMSSSSYFIESRLERDKKRGEMITSLNSIINNQNTSDEMKTQALDIRLSTITNTEKEVFLENMIMAKGFNDAIVYLSDQSINIVVSSQGLTEKDVAQIVDIVRRETDVIMDNITIMSKK